jgi:hypothetical protein
MDVPLEIERRDQVYLVSIDAVVGNLDVAGLRRPPRSFAHR